ncbi:MAG: hypothetical protein ACRD88_01530, partial [Terriglobia bacterium]
MKRVWLAAFVCAVIWMLEASPAGAQAPSPNGVTREEMQQLREEIAVLQRRLDGLLARVESNGHAETPVSATPVAMSTAAAPVQATGQIPGQGQTDRGLYGGLAAGPPDQRYGRGLLGDAVKIGGYGSFRFEANNIDLGPRIGSLPPIQRGFNAFDFRRFVLTLDATPTDRLRVYTELEFERFNEIEVERTAIPENRGRQNRAGTRFIEEVEGQDG